MKTLRQEIAYLRENGFHRNTIEHETLLAWLGEQVAIEADLEAARATVSQLQQQVESLKRKPLTDEQIIDAVRDAGLGWMHAWVIDETLGKKFANFARAIERAHGITGGQHG